MASRSGAIALENYDMNKQLTAFVEDHPDGWNHDQWLSLLADLRADGADVSDPAAIGEELEKLRLGATLRGCDVPGLGPKRIEAVVEEFGTLWRLRHAHAEDVAAIKTVPAAVAEKVVAAVR